MLEGVTPDSQDMWAGGGREDRAPWSIITPTYREATNLGPLADRIAAVCPPGSELLAVDDDSGDGIEAVAARADARHERLRTRVLVRRGVPRDLSRAVLAGVREATHDMLIVLDADLSHPPERIGALVDAVLAGAAVAVGSRFVTGGRTHAAWGGGRRLQSAAASWLVRPVLPGGVRLADPMSGFFAVRRSTVEAARPLSPVGYKVLLELIVKSGSPRVAEVPIDFAERASGVSKLGWRTRAAFLRHVASLAVWRLTRRRARVPDHAAEPAADV